MFNHTDIDINNNNNNNNNNVGSTHGEEVHPGFL
jgi:hypothetical protein